MSIEWVRGPVVIVPEKWESPGWRKIVVGFIVVGPRGIGGIARALLGSVTTWLLNEAPCPVAVIPGD